MIPGEVGGTETYLCKTIEAICHRFPETKLTIFTNFENHLKFSSMLSKYPQTVLWNLNFHAKNRYVRILREQIELPIKAKKSGIHVLWNPGYTAPIFTHFPQVVTIHDMQYKRHPEDLTPVARFTTDFLIKAAARRVQAFITVSNFSKKEITRFTSIPEAKIHVTPLGVEMIQFKDKACVERLEPLSRWLSSSEKYILTVANTYPHKNLHTLVQAFTRIEDKIPHKLVMLGKPRLGEKHLIESLSGMSNPDRVIRISRLSRQDLFSLYRCSDLFVFPSLYEGFGLPVLEAMMCEVPVITTKMASIPEVGGSHVIYVEQPTPESFSEKILEVMDWEKAFRRKFIKHAKNWATKFSWRDTGEKTMEILMQAATSEKK